MKEIEEIANDSDSPLQYLTNKRAVKKRLDKERKNNKSQQE